MPLPLRLATFNLESLDDQPSRAPSLDERIAVLRPRLLRLAADLLCLQEVNGQHPPGGGPRALLALDRLLQDTPYAAFERAVAGSARDGGIADVHNLVVLSRFPITAARALRHELVTPPSYRPATAQPTAGRSAGPAETEPQAVTWDRPLLQVEIALPGGRRLHLIDLHLRAPLAAPIAGQKEGPFMWKSVAGWAEGFYLATLKRSGQALEARLALEALFDREAEPLIAVVGDFNAEERETPLRTLRGEPSDTGNPGLAGRALISLERSLPESRRYSVLHQGIPAMLDHVLVSRALFAHYREVEILNEGLPDEILDEDKASARAASFHAPIVAEFVLPDYTNG
ncbi:MAG: endonuclease/exonuclease/phosphatase family protein, partial [Kiloniellales bacterium]